MAPFCWILGLFFVFGLVCFVLFSSESVKSVYISSLPRVISSVWTW